VPAEPSQPPQGHRQLAAVEVLAPWVRLAPIGVESLSEFLDRWITA
jgi:hypothetical protein